jgi:hypothetical protein
MWFKGPTLVIVAALLVGACGSPSESSDAAGGDSITSTTLDPDTPVSSTPSDPGGGDQGSGPRVVEPQPGQADLHTIPWQRVDVGPDDRTLHIRFTSGVEPCYVLDHIDVDYRKTKVFVTLYEGHEPSDEDVACIEIAEFKITKVQLTEPLGGREVKDGARN